MKVHDDRTRSIDLSMKRRTFFDDAFTTENDGQCSWHGVAASMEGELGKELSLASEQG